MELELMELEPITRVLITAYYSNSHSDLVCLSSGIGETGISSQTRKSF